MKREPRLTTFRLTFVDSASKVGLILLRDSKVNSEQIHLLEIFELILYSSLTNLFRPGALDKDATNRNNML